MHYMDTNETHEKTRWERHKNAKYYIEQIQEETATKRLLYGHQLTI